MTTQRGSGLVDRSLTEKSDHKASHEWVGETCKWCAVRRDWPAAAARCRGGTVKNQAAVNARARVAKSIAKAKAAASSGGCGA